MAHITVTPHSITKYYLDQAGGGGGHYYVGSNFQKGHGIGSFLGGLFRSVLPILRSGASAVGREAARAGAHVLADVAAGDNLKQSLKAHGRQAVTNLKRKAAAEMSGSGRRPIKRRKKATPRHSTTTARGKRKLLPAVFV